MNSESLVSVIIPARNEEENIRNCIISIRNLNIPEHVTVEVIVVDNGSTDRTAEIAMSLGATVFSLSSGNIPTLRNFGALKAHGEIFAFVDADCVVSRNWLKIALDELINIEVGATGSNYRLQKADNWIASTCEFNMREYLSRGETNWIQSGNLIIRRKVFKQVNGFNELLSTCEDSDICYRIRNIGYKIISNSEICSYHLGFPRSIISFFKKELWYGRGIPIAFLAQNTRRRYLGVFIYSAVFTLCLMLLFVGCIMLNKMVMFTSILSMTVVSLILAIKTSIEKKTFKFYMQLIVLNLIFGIARGISFFNFHNWRKTS